MVLRPCTNGQVLAAIYARVSTEDQRDRGYSLPTQIDACQVMAAQLGYTVPDGYIYVEDYPGTSLRRPELTKLRELITAKAIHAVIVYDIDRLSRKLAHQLLLTDEFQQASVDLHIVLSPQQDKSPEGQLLTNVRGIIAEYERSKLLERTRRGQIGRARAGHVPGGKPPLGYLRQGNGYVIDPDAADRVRRIFDMYIHQRLSQDAIAQRLTSERVTPPSGRRGVWHQNSVHKILTNETYIGTMLYGKRSRIPGKANPDKNTRWRKVAESEQVSIAVPPLIDEAMFQAAQARMAQARKVSPRNRVNPYLLIDGHLRCGQCFGIMSGDSWGNYPRYRCKRRPYHPPEHTLRSVAAAEIEPVVWAAVARALQNPRLIAHEVSKRYQDTSESQRAIAKERQQYEKQLAQCEREAQRWEVAYAEEVIGLAEFKTKRQELDDRRKGIESELAKLDAQERSLEHIRANSATLIQYCKRVAEHLQHFTLDEKQLVMEALSIVATWTPGKPLDIQGSIPIGIESNASWRA